MPYDFEDIRPYQDAEVRSVLQALIADDEFLRTMKQVRLAWMPNWLYLLTRPYLRWSLARKVSGIDSVRDVQLTVDGYLKECLDNTTSSLEIGGVESLSSRPAFLAMCNHRDITMDPAICNTSVNAYGVKTFRVAIGDNLLTRDFAANLMRLNKSFIVKRSVEGARQKLLELKKLSAYIRLSITADHEPVWIAQREGRAKDGKDRTDPALIKMLLLSKSKQQSLSDGVKELNLIPASISYEWDPCDLSKARELAAIARDGSYQKREGEDIESIAAGIGGWKGRVDLRFGQELRGEFENVEQVAAAVDRQIILSYRIQPSNAVAYEQLEGELPEVAENWSDEEITAARTELNRRKQLLLSDEQQILIQTYANPVYSRLGILDQSVQELSEASDG